MRNFEQSIELYIKIIEKERNPEFVRELANSYKEKKDFKNAIYTFSLLQVLPINRYLLLRALKKPNVY